MKLVITTVIALLIPYSTNAGNSEQMKEIISEAMQFEHGTFPDNITENDFVKIRLIIEENGTIRILETNSSNEHVKLNLISRLSQIKILDPNQIGQVYNYHFSIKRL